ncbi:MAG: WhiB family transcriptional regulator [Actinomycetota bacterium]
MTCITHGPTGRFRLAPKGTRSPSPDQIAALLAALGEVPSWHASALCAQTDPEVFFPEKGASSAAARRVCAVCPVELECRAEAMDRREPFGVWGGTTEADRRRLRRQARLDQARASEGDVLGGDAA